MGQYVSQDSKRLSEVAIRHHTMCSDNIDIDRCADGIEPDDYYTQHVSVSRVFGGLCLGLNEDETRDRLFHPMMTTLGYPSPSEGGPTRYDQQGYVGGGFFDGCYMYQDRPLVLVELKAEGLLTYVDGSLKQEKLDRYFEEQTLPYALSDDFEEPPPYLVISDGIQFAMYETTRRDPKNPRYQRLGKLLSWSEAIQVSPGKYSQRMIKFSDLTKKISPFLDSIHASTKMQLERILRGETTDLDGCTFKSGVKQTLDDLMTRTEKSLDTKDRSKVLDEIAATSTLNYLNKVIFLKYTEDNDLDSFFKILSELELTMSLDKRDKSLAGVATALFKRECEQQGVAISQDVFSSVCERTQAGCNREIVMVRHHTGGIRFGGSGLPESLCGVVLRLLLSVSERSERTSRSAEGFQL